MQLNHSSCPRLLPTHCFASCNPRRHSSQRLVAEKEKHPKNDLISDAIKQQVSPLQLWPSGPRHPLSNTVLLRLSLQL